MVLTPQNRLTNSQPRQQMAPPSSLAPGGEGRPITPPAPRRIRRKPHPILDLAAPGSRVASVSLLNGQLDVKDTFQVWLEAEVGDVSVAKGKVLIHYSFYTQKWDEWIDINSDRIDNFGSHIFLPGGPLRLGSKVDVFDPHPSQNKWLEAKVVAERWVSPAGPASGDAPASASPAGGAIREVKIKYKGFTDSSSEWIPEGSERITGFGWQTRQRHPFQQKKVSYWREHGRKAQLRVKEADGQVSLDERVRHYLTVLAEAGLRLEPMGGDGNCLFR